MEGLVEAARAFAEACDRARARQIALAAADFGRDHAPASPSCGELAFDEPTRRFLTELRKRPVDCFGEVIKVEGKRNPIIAALEEGPARPAQLAAMLGVTRAEVGRALDIVVRTGAAICDDEGFYSLSVAAAPSR